MRNLAEALSGDRIGFDLARVLLVHGELAPRLALQTILRASGYAVEVASNPGEAINKLDEGQYELVLSDARDVLSYARVKDYHPATAMVRSSEDEGHKLRRGHQISIYTENLPHLLAEVAELIGIRASRRYRPLRHAV